MGYSARSGWKWVLEQSRTINRSTLHGQHVRDRDSGSHGSCPSVGARQPLPLTTWRGRLTVSGHVL